MLFETNVTCDPGVFATNSLAFRTYLQTFLLYPVQMSTPVSAACCFMISSSPTVGAPGFSRYIRQHTAAMASPRSRGLSTVRPLMRVSRLTPSAFGGTADSEVWNWTPCSASVFSLNSANSGPPGPLAPGPKNHGSTMWQSLAVGHSPRSI